jgi:hypothetical protein
MRIKQHFELREVTSSSGIAQRRDRLCGRAGRFLARQDWCDRSADCSFLVIRSPKREGRVQSAERTEVHLIATIRFHELTFCP